MLRIASPDELGHADWQGQSGEDSLLGRGLEIKILRTNHNGMEIHPSVRRICQTARAPGILS
jgi:hypothetical protein